MLCSSIYQKLAYLKVSRIEAYEFYNKDVVYGEVVGHYHMYN